MTDADERARVLAREDIGLSGDAAATVAADDRFRALADLLADARAARGEASAGFGHLHEAVYHLEAAAGERATEILEGGR